MTKFKGFDDLDDLSFDYVSNESTMPSTIEDASKKMSNKDKGTWIEEVCMKCNGSGVYRLPSSHGTHCFACNGAGKRLFRKSKEERAAARAKAAERKLNKAKPLKRPTRISPHGGPVATLTLPFLFAKI